MSNDYYNASTLISRQSKAISAQVNAILQAIAAGFEKLPSQSNLNRNTVTYAVATGTANTYAAAMPATLTAYATGQHFRIQIPATNTGASTLNIDGQGARAIKRVDGTDVEAGDLTSGDIVDLVFNGTSLVMLGSYRSHLAGIASNLGANLAFTGAPTFSGNPVFTGAPNFNGITNKSTVRSHLGLAMETGTWTPVLSDGTNTATAAVGTNGTYTYNAALKECTVRGRYVVSSLGSLSGNLRLNGLPFVVQNSSAGQSCGICTDAGGLSLSSAAFVGLFTQQAGDYLLLKKPGASGTNNLLHSDINSSFDIQFSLSYRTE